MKLYSYGKIVLSFYAIPGLHDTFGNVAPRDNLEGAV